MLPPHIRRTMLQEGAELEALQADVMRFVAIIGLCLAAIFSLLRSVEPPVPAATTPLPPDAVAVEAAAPSPILHHEVEPRTRPPQRPVPSVDAVEQTATAVSAPSPAPQATPEPPAVEAKRGFSLSFTSDRALLQLLDSRRVELFAIEQDRYWQYSPDDRRFRPSQGPARYHEMQPSTVPVELQRRLVAAGVGEARWGIVLPPDILDSLDRVMRAAEAGELLIDAAGQVQSRTAGG